MDRLTVGFCGVLGFCGSGVLWFWGSGEWSGVQIVRRTINDISNAVEFEMDEFEMDAFEHSLQ